MNSTDEYDDLENKMLQVKSTSKGGHTCNCFHISAVRAESRAHLRRFQQGFCLGQHCSGGRPQTPTPSSSVKVVRKKSGEVSQKSRKESCAELTHAPDQGWSRGRHCLRAPLEAPGRTGCDRSSEQTDPVWRSGG